MNCAGMMASVSTPSPKRCTVPLMAVGRCDQTAGSRRPASSSPCAPPAGAGALGSASTGAGSETANEGAGVPAAAASPWHVVGVGIHWRSASYRAWSTAARKGVGSVTVSENDDAATTAADARLAMEPLPMLR
jgi:hypothetical protein